MAVTQRLQPTIKTGIALTPQLQQTIALIQKNKTELLELVREELDANPALEEKVDADPDAQTAEIEAAEKRVDSGAGAAEDRSQDDWDPADWERYREYLQSPSGVRGAVEIGRSVPMDNMLANAETLASHLNSQIAVRLDSETDIRICEAIVGNLNRAGYLDASLEEIQIMGDGAWSIADVERGLAHVQALDPCGVGARDKRECLLLQINQNSSQPGLADVLVRHHFESCELNRFDGLAKHLGVTDDELRDAVALINRLDRDPGLAVVPHKPEYLIPDVKVIREAGSYLVEFVEAGMPRVRVNPDFMPISDNAADEHFRRANLESAKNLLKAIDQRKITILKVARSIVQYQEQFMESGVTALRPLVLREIADAIGMHESTVSRVVHNKAIDTPHGVFAMKFFFPTRIPCRNGEDVSSGVVKLRIRDIIQRENREKPLSDSKIHALLQGHGYDLARRTVAKYREELQFPIASQRRGWVP